MHKREAPEPLMERAPVSLGDSATIYSHVYLIFDISQFVTNISYDNHPLSSRPKSMHGSHTLSKNIAFFLCYTQITQHKWQI